MTYYRIVRDCYLGFEVQAWRWWFPFWLQCGVTNTHHSIEEAEQFAKEHASGSVKMLGRLTHD